MVVVIYAISLQLSTQRTLSFLTNLEDVVMVLIIGPKTYYFPTDQKTTLAFKWNVEAYSSKEKLRLTYVSSSQASSYLEVL